VKSPLVKPNNEKTQNQPFLKLTKKIFPNRKFLIAVPVEKNPLKF